MNDQPVTPSQKPDLADVFERRRPGRIEHVSPQLIPLLRRSYAVPALPTSDAGFIRPGMSSGVVGDQQDDADDLRPAFGIAVALIAATIFWLDISALIWWFES